MEVDRKKQRDDVKLKLKGEERMHVMRNNEDRRSQEVYVSAIQIVDTLRHVKVRGGGVGVCPQPLCCC